MLKDGKSDDEKQLKKRGGRRKASGDVEGEGEGEGEGLGVPHCVHAHVR